MAQYRKHKVILLLVLLLMTGCADRGDDPAAHIIGKWESGGFDFISPVEFYEGGTVQGTVRSVPIAGDYEWVDDNEVKISAGPLSTVVEVYFAGEEEMTLVISGAALKYHRID